jgi:hypothetical protein
MLKSTRLRYIAAPEIAMLLTAVESLTFRVEVKGNPVRDGKLWFLFFVLPDDDRIRFNSIVLK